MTLKHIYDCKVAFGAGRRVDVSDVAGCDIFSFHIPTCLLGLAISPNFNIWKKPIFHCRDIIPGRCELFTFATDFIQILYLGDNRDQIKSNPVNPSGFPSNEYLLRIPKGWFKRATQTQMQAQANARVNYHNANTNANARNGKFFISLRLHLHFTRVNQDNAKANVPCLYGLSSKQDGIHL